MTKPLHPEYGFTASFWTDTTKLATVLIRLPKTRYATQDEARLHAMTIAKTLADNEFPANTRMLFRLTKP